MAKKYVVTLTDAERATCEDVIRRSRASSQEVRRAMILRQSDAAGPAWTDRQIAGAYHCRTRTVELLRRRLVEDGFAAALDGKARVTPPRAALLDGEGQARLIALRLGSPPAGFGAWSLRLLAARAVELGIAPGISHETCRRVLKKTA